MAKVAVRRSARPIDLAAATLLAAALWLVLALGAMAQVSTIRSHGISTFGDLKYGPDYAHLGYVNPNAPKGGEISIWASGGFDSYNPYSIKGRAAALSSAPLESLLTGTSDEIGSAYGLLAESMEY
ncbi:MAG: ABC transporter substrate-binding protein, partial [Phaeovulum sp.]|nr:ABC transporter substrate-binding protein [Phaeovulum sp.]